MKLNFLLVLRIIAAAILLQTLYFKFTAAPESQFIFQSLGVEPWGRILTGLLELVACIFLFIPSMQIFGAILAASIMLGAVAGHLFVLGIVVQDDGGLLFLLACIVLAFNLMILFMQKTKVMELFFKMKKSCCQ